MLFITFTSLCHHEQQDGPSCDMVKIPQGIRVGQPYILVQRLFANTYRLVTIHRACVTDNRETNRTMC